MGRFIPTCSVDGAPDVTARASTHAALDLAIAYANADATRLGRTIAWEITPAADGDGFIARGTTSPIAAS